MRLSVSQSIVDPSYDQLKLLLGLPEFLSTRIERLITCARLPTTDRNSYCARASVLELQSTSWPRLPRSWSRTDSLHARNASMMNKYLVILYSYSYSIRLLKVHNIKPPGSCPIPNMYIGTCPFSCVTKINRQHFSMAHKRKLREHIDVDNGQLSGGDWCCISCSMWNFARRDECKRSESEQSPVQSPRTLRSLSMYS